MSSRFRAGVTISLTALGVAVVAEQCRCLYGELAGDPAVALQERASEADLNGAESVSLWQEARRLRPRSAPVGVSTALALERAGRRAEAERVLLETEWMNRLWLPRWSLASFYLRNQRKVEAAHWGRLALERSYAGVRPALFALLEEAKVPSAEWVRWCGSNPEMLAGAVEYFGESGKLAELAVATRQLAGLGPGRAPGFWRDTVKTACGRLVRAGDGAAAAEAWNALVARGALPFNRVEAANLIGNAGFAGPIDGEAFNWRFWPLPGVSRVFDPERRVAGFRFDGSQPERCELLAAGVWLAGGKRHRLSFRYRASGWEAEQTGPVWTLAEEVSGPLAQGMNGSEWHAGAMEIRPREAGKIAVLALRLDRRHGFTRAAGEVEVGDLRLEAVQ